MRNLTPSNVLGVAAGFVLVVVTVAIHVGIVYAAFHFINKYW